MSGDVLIVDWLGRGGIAQTTEAWALELMASGHAVTVVSRPGRELAGDGYDLLTAEAGAPGGVRAHRAVARAAAGAVRRLRPAVVVVQGSIVPLLERPVLGAAAAVGARRVMVVHNDRPHSPLSGTGLGYDRLLGDADTVVAHTRFVADRIGDRVRAPVQVIPLPVQIGMLRLPPVASPVPASAGPARLALHFGVVARRYKGGDVVSGLASDPPAGWRVAAVGRGASGIAGATSVDRFVDASELVAAVAGSAATVLPYRRATQSGAVVLAQASGSVPVASAVGGLPEQIVDGRTGILLPAGASVATWRSALAGLHDDDLQAMATAGREAAWAAHDEFTERVNDLVAA